MVNPSEEPHEETALPSTLPRPVEAETPQESIPTRISNPKKVAAGPPSVMTVTKRAFQEVGMIRSLKVLNKVNQVGGFDCPGCAWPDPSHRSALGEYCENGAKAVIEEATTQRLTPAFFREWSVEELSKKSDYWLGKQGRLTQPMILRRGSSHYEPIAWEAAFQHIGNTLKSLDSPDQAIFYTSGRTSNEAAFLYQLFIRRFGTNNMPDCSNLCHESSGIGLKEVIGVGKGTVTLGDFQRAKVILIVGQNPGTNHPRMLSTLQRAKKGGCRIIHINPLPEAGMSRFRHPQKIAGWLGPGTPMADRFLQVRINGDVALFKGFIKYILEAEASRGGVVDREFIDSHTVGYEALRDDAMATPWEVIVEESGISQEDIGLVAEELIGTRQIIICWAMGLTQHKNAVANIQSIVNTLLLRGAIGIPGGGVCPVRGHSNVQGDRTVGITSRPSASFLQRLSETFRFDPPRTWGLDTVASIEALHEGKAHVFLAMGGNLLSAGPDTAYTAEALQQSRLSVQISTKLNRGHLITGEEALILPCLGRTEIDRQEEGTQFVSVENSMGIIHTSEGVLEPASEDLLSEPAIVAGIGKATLGDHNPIDWDWLVADYDRIRDLIEEVVPGFENYNVRVREEGGFYLPNAARDGVFETKTGKAHFTTHDIPRYNLPDDRYLMMTIRSHDQYNTTIYGLNDRYRGIQGGRRVVMVNEEDMAAAGLGQGDVVDLVSHFEGEERVARRFVVVPYDLPRKCVATYFPETNVLVPLKQHADKSFTPASKSVVVTMHRSEDLTPFDYDTAAEA